MDPTIDTPTEVELLARLASHDTLKVAPRDELLWLIHNGELRTYRTGQPILRRDMRCRKW